MKAKYMVCTADMNEILEDGFLSYDSAYRWMYLHDWGQYKDVGGLVVRPYTGRPKRG